VSADLWANAIRANYDLASFHSISFTGGEPLLYREFLHEMAAKLRSEVKFFLETSGHAPALLTEAAEDFDYISVDLKMHIEPFLQHADRLLSAVGLISQDKIYVKLPLRREDDSRIAASAELLSRYAIQQVWLQPIDNAYELSQVFSWQATFAKQGIDARFVPQMHKLMGIQ
jgi:organic radical activating enzyme